MFYYKVQKRWPPMTYIVVEPCPTLHIKADNPKDALEIAEKMSPLEPKQYYWIISVSNYSVEDA